VDSTGVEASRPPPARARGGGAVGLQRVAMEPIPDWRQGQQSNRW